MSSGRPLDIALRSAVVLALTGSVLLTGCRPKPMQSLRFRSLQSSTAFARAVTSLETQVGVHRASREAGTIVSDWWDPNIGQGIPPKYIYVRWAVSVSENPSDDSADIRVRPQAVLCSVLASKDPDRRARECGPLDQAHGAIVPDSIYERHEELVQTLKEDVFRRE